MFERHALHPKLLKRLKSVIDATDGRIVLAAWRMVEEKHALLDALIDQGINPNAVVGRTPVLGLSDLHWSGDHSHWRRQGGPRRSWALPRHVAGRRKGPLGRRRRSGRA